MFSIYSFNGWILRFVVLPVFLVAALLFWAAKRDLPSTLIAVGCIARSTCQVLFWLETGRQVSTGTEIGISLGMVPVLVSQFSTILIAAGLLAAVARVWKEKKAQPAGETDG